VPIQLPEEVSCYRIQTIIGIRNVNIMITKQQLCLVKCCECCLAIFEDTLHSLSAFIFEN
jgi:hypothetical protein